MQNRIGFFFNERVWMVKTPGNKDSHELLETGASHGEMSEIVFESTTDQGIKISIECDGLIIIDFENYAADLDLPASMGQMGHDEKTEAVFHKIFNRSKLLNAFSVLLNAAIQNEDKFVISATVASAKNYLLMDAVDNPNKGIRFTSAQSSARYYARYNQTKANPFFSGGDLAMRGYVVRTELLEQAVSEFQRLLNLNDDHAVVSCEILNSGMEAIDNYNYPIALVSFWAVIEGLLNILWRKHIISVSNQATDSGAKFINSPRKTKLTSPEFTASVVSENLSLLNVISFEEYANIDKVRRLRNDWMHKLKPASWRDVLEALKTASELYTKVFGIELPKGAPVGFAI